MKILRVVGKVKDAKELEILRKEMVDAQDKLRAAQKDFDQKNKVFQKALAEATKKK